MDSYGVDRAVVIGWSAGVNVAFEAAVRQPPRMSPACSPSAACREDLSKRCYASWVEPVLRRTGQSVAQPVEHRPEVAHQV